MRRPGILVALCTLLVAAGMVGPTHADVSLQARLVNSRIAVGGTTVLEVAVDGAGADVGDPVVTIPEGLVRLSTSRSQNFSWINGKSATRTQFRIEIGADRAGAFAVGPIRVRLGSQWYESQSVTLTVLAAHEAVPGSGGRLAQLIADVTPRNPHVGEPAILRVRLVQRAPLVEDPEYTPPATPGFWAERSTAPTSYYADQAGTRVLVTETRTRLYPLAAGVAHIGEAGVVLTLSLSSMSGDPQDWLRGGGLRRQLAVRSVPVDVQVVPLRGGAPAEFEGAVGHFTATWSADRSQTALDVPVTVWLDVRGLGNLPLLHTPALAAPDAEVFSSTLQDSLGTPGTLSAGRRRFQWTVLPRREGTLRLAPPTLVWFDYTTGRYERLDAPPVEIGVKPALRPSGPGNQAWPAAFAAHPADPFAREALPWGFAAAGALIGWGLRGLRAARRRAVSHSAAAPAWLEGLRHTRGAAFWAAASRACDELESRGVAVGTWRGEVERARYGGAGIVEEPVRAALVDQLRRVSPDPRRAARDWIGPAVAIAAGIALVAVSLPRPGSPASVQRSLHADRAAAAGDVEGASRAWRVLWRGGGHHPGVAARLAWAGERAGAIGDASAWVLRGDAGDPRDPALDWVAANVRDAGGLAGYARARLPVRALEWALAALACGLGLAWVGRRWTMALLAAALLLAAAPSLDRWRASRHVRAVVRGPVTLQGEGVELVAGQVVTVRGGGGGRTNVEVGSGIRGWVPSAALEMAGGPP